MLIMQKISRVKSPKKEKRKARISPIHVRAKECSDFSVFFIDLFFFPSQETMVSRKGLGVWVWVYVLVSLL